MIICNIIGGLGNQMFQYACGRALSLRSSQPIKFSVDNFKAYELHNGLEINKVFRCRPLLAEDDELKRVLGWQHHPNARRLLGRPAMRWLTHGAWRNEPHFHYWPGLKSSAGDMYLHGYWQSERYFLDAADTIREDFEFSLDWDVEDLAVFRRMKAGPSVSVHVRRGDYANKKNISVFASVGIDYYKRAITYLLDREPDSKIFLFSDEPDWAEAQLRPVCGPLTTVTHNAGLRSVRDMRLMSAATHHVIANSSFSWWGAWLNSSRDKIVVAPRQWFVNEQVRSSADLTPPQWVRL